MEIGNVPVLSFAAAHTAEFASQLEQGWRRYGFVVLRDHGIDPGLLDRAYQCAEQLFALPEAQKRQYAAGLRGYTPFGKEHARDHAAPDLKEFWQIGRELPGDPAFAANRWPLELPEFRPVFLDLYRALDAVGVAMLEALAPGLGLQPGWFRERVARGNSILRIIHYPPLAERVPSGSLRSAPHEDINFITIMVAARGAGLELRDEQGRWLPVRADARQLIVNTGDMLARLTNGRIAAKTHRVVNPETSGVSRYSMPFFMHPEDSVSLECLPSCLGDGARFAPMTAGEFLAERVREIGL
jgi:isopenicillin N synthase-like dioxygenase